MSPRRAAGLATLAVALTVASAFLVQRDDVEVGIYGIEGTLHDNVRPRLVGGWPAPFLVDSTATSVPFDLGLEDDLRPGPMVADVAFWFLALSAVGRLMRRRPRARTERV